MNWYTDDKYSVRDLLCSKPSSVPVPCRQFKVLVSMLVLRSYFFHSCWKAFTSSPKTLSIAPLNGGEGEGECECDDHIYSSINQTFSAIEL